MKPVNLNICMSDEEYDLFQKLSQPIDNYLQLSVRARNACKFNNLILVGDICRADYNRILKYRKFGKVLADELISKLNDLGFQIGLKQKMSDRFWTIYHFYRESYILEHEK